MEDVLGRHRTEATRGDLSGTIWPQPQTFHLPLTNEVGEALRLLGERFAQPEMCDHLVVYRDEDILLSAYDAGIDIVWVSRALPTHILEQLRSLATNG